MKNLRLGDKGETVKTLQRRLKKEGFYTGPISGIYSYATENAVEMAQFAYGIMADGVAGPVTFDALSIIDNKHLKPDISNAEYDFSSISNLWHKNVRDSVLKHFNDGFRIISPYIDKVHLATDIEKALFTGQARQETGPRFKLEENLNYRCSALPVIFRAYRGKQGRMLASKHGRCFGRSANQRTIANTAYGNRQDLGNIEQDDGWFFKGAGVGGLTGRNNYKKYKIWLKRNLPSVYKKYKGNLILEEGFHLISNSPHAFLSFVYFWHTKKLYMGARLGMTQEASNYVTARVNKRTRSYRDRWFFSKKAYKLLIGNQ